VDPIAAMLRQKIEELLATRPDVTRADFGRAIARGDSWISEFFNDKRTTNDLRLVVRMARFFGVPVGFLLHESHREDDAQTVSLIGAWRDLDTDHRETVLQLALRLRPKPRPPGTPGGQ